MFVIDEIEGIVYLRTNDSEYTLGGVCDDYKDDFDSYIHYIKSPLNIKANREPNSYYNTTVTILFKSKDEKLALILYRNNSISVAKASNFIEDSVSKNISYIREML